MLRALVLATGHDAGGDMGDAHRGIRGVDMLAAAAARAVRINTEIFRLDFDLNRIVNFRTHENAGERRVPALGLIERRDAH